MFSRDQLSRSDKLRLTKLSFRLLDWYATNGRALPWRDPAANTYEKICVEVLLQRTRAENVAMIYPRFFGRFTSWQAIADADINDLEQAFKPIGLWRRRAKSIKALAIYAADRAGIFPSNLDELTHIPAVGQYVGNAILLFQHGQSRPLIDSNMARVIERYLRPRTMADIRHDPWLQAASGWLVRGQDPVRVNWATLDLAHAFCRSRKPKCANCVLNKWCNFGKLAKND